MTPVVDSVQGVQQIINLLILCWAMQTIQTSKESIAPPNTFHIFCSLFSLQTLWFTLVIVQNALGLLALIVKHNVFYTDFTLADYNAVVHRHQTTWVFAILIGYPAFLTSAWLACFPSSYIPYIQLAPILLALGIASTKRYGRRRRFLETVLNRGREPDLFFYLIVIGFLVSILSHVFLLLVLNIYWWFGSCVLFLYVFVLKAQDIGQVPRSDRNRILGFVAETLMTAGFSLGVELMVDKSKFLLDSNELVL